MSTSASTSARIRMSRASPCRVAVIGGGASGIFSSIQAACQIPHGNVVVLESGPKTLGKVKISGGGRCNVLHDTSKPPEEILQGYPRGSRELKGLYHKHFTPQDARKWFTSRGVTLKTEEDGRMFPTTDSSQTIINTLLQAAEDAGVHIQPKQKVQTITKDDQGKFLIEFRDESKHVFDAVILATGSNVAGHHLAKSLGHKIVSPVPSLFTLNAKHQIKEGGMFHGLSGLSVPSAELTFKVPIEGKKKKRVLQQSGPLLITHHGISGPATLRLSAFAAREFHQENYRGDLLVHWAPSLGSTDEIAEKLWRCTTLSPKKSVSTSFPLTMTTGSDEPAKSAIPRRLWAAMVAECGFEKETQWSAVSKKKIRTLARMVAECVVDVTGKGVFKEEFVTAGGVALNEIDMKTMQSKKCSGLFLCGEVIDVDGVTGGFNFMNCWSTGWTAGNGIAQYLAQDEEG